MTSIGSVAPVRLGRHHLLEREEDGADGAEHDEVDAEVEERDRAERQAVLVAGRRRW